MAEQANPATLNPLPLGLPEGTPAAAAAPNGAAVEPLDPVSQWLEENPKFEEPAVTPEPQAATPDATPNTETATPPQAATFDPSATAPATTAPVATQQPTPESAAPVAPATTLAGDEKIKLSSDTEWTRDQIVEALKERATAAPLAKEAEGFRTLFGMPLEEAQRAWGPVMQRLATEPKTVAFLDAYLADPSKAAYLEKCAAHYDQQAPSAPAAPPAAAIDPALKKEVDDLRAWRMQQEKQAAQDRLNREWQQATTKYPFLATDAALRNDLMLTAQALHAQDNSKGLLDALALKAALYDAKLIASQAPAATATPP
ncbi:MAG: hypothetical protein KGL39_49235, partial [Patescibacteria group bacterium]|nr:hypothetical protein [Patescibacteria group bacterium]